MSTMNQLLSSLADPLFFDRAFNKPIDWDSKLYARDEDAFEAAWIACHTRVNEQCSDEDEKFKKVREDAFRGVCGVTRDPLLADCVAEDMGLIAQAFEIGCEDEFIAMLWATYQRGEFPGQL